MSVTPIPDALRWEVWSRDDFRCRSCGSRLFLVIDHIKPERHGGRTVSDNLQTLCQSCNSRKRDHITAYIEPGARCTSSACWCARPADLQAKGKAMLKAIPDRPTFDRIRLWRIDAWSSSPHWSASLPHYAVLGPDGVVLPELEIDA